MKDGGDNNGEIDNDNYHCQGCFCVCVDGWMRDQLFVV